MTPEELSALSSRMYQISSAALEMQDNSKLTDNEAINISSIYESSSRAGTHIQALANFHFSIDQEIIDQWQALITSAELVLQNPINEPSIEYNLQILDLMSSDNNLNDYSHNTSETASVNSDHSINFMEESLLNYHGSLY